MTTPLQTATFGAGCYWQVEEDFHHVPGVRSTTVGYMGGTKPNPTYEEVCTDKTGHAEVLQLTYDPIQVTYEQLLGIFFSHHNPTELNRQGPDVGTQYRSIVFYHTPEQRAAAERFREDLAASRKWGQKEIVTSIEPAREFWKAEDYHQEYLHKQGRTSCRV
jgi:peptide-methionine (S)-S-oxide reductase